MATATIFEAKTKFSELLKKAQRGEEVIITSGRDRTPVAKLLAIEPVSKQRLGVMETAGFVLPDSFFDPMPEEELVLWEGGGE